ncbi:hypothetical protein M3M35_03720 [Fructilactobacillus myrtifloralis]|uniref:Uncharacterized protein n=1 Tax=Fructilactobacillus myrtifloralis TaxID=2940301 RepID=A0ABY5BRF7_9LACO|nr:hypothetical protein [Fructilactobacillus myrtifloralis]USS85825.1 hypothetical protein M3M35_03720 [Fructilactobacillus myrtifloralis]
MVNFMEELFIIRHFHTVFTFIVSGIALLTFSSAGTTQLSVQAASHHAKTHHHCKGHQQKHRQRARHRQTKQVKTPTPKPAPTTSEPVTNNEPDPQPNSAGTIIGNSRTLVYHTPDQSNYHINSGNIVSFDSEAEAQAAGYHKSTR